MSQLNISKTLLKTCLILTFEFKVLYEYLYFSHPTSKNCIGFSSFEAQAVHKEFYTGGLVQVNTLFLSNLDVEVRNLLLQLFVITFQITQDGKTLLCHCSNHIAIVDVEQALIQQTVPPNLTQFNPCEEEDIIDDPILAFTLSSNGELLATGHKSGLIKLWKWKCK